MVKRIFVEKKRGMDVGAQKTRSDIAGVLGLACEDVRQFIRYDIEDLDPELFAEAKATIFSEPPVDDVFEDKLPPLDGYATFIVEYLPGQYDQRADSAMQCVQLLSAGERPLIKCATVYAVKGCDEHIDAIKKYIINPVESREGSAELPDTLVQKTEAQTTVPTIDGFVAMSDPDVAAYHAKIGFAMSVDDLVFVRDYFKGEGRDPSETELKVIDTYWSDHCRHTTFATELTDIRIDSQNPHLKAAFDLYSSLFAKFNSKRKDKYRCLMDIATIAVKELVSQGKLDNLDVSEEINACSVNVTVDVDGKPEEWLIMFKNETHNHPTEIEPFGGAATCLGGAIRDPLSGRAYVYQAMRVTGCADPNESIDKTLKGKLPQRVITKTAAAGYSSYGNQIGLATGLVHEMYDEGYKAKRLETGYVIGGVKKSDVVRQRPVKGDVVILLGGDTGRDGCGGATGSSKAHTEKSVEVCGAEVQKGNPPTERKLQRLFRNPEASRLILKCNDFGAGGVSVAIGELADSLDIYLDRVPKKYDGLSGTELAISESQERMAVVVAASSVERFKQLAAEENLNATVVAEVTDTGSMRMYFAGRVIVDLKRSFLDTNGVKQRQSAHIVDAPKGYLDAPQNETAKAVESGDLDKALLGELKRLNVCSQKGMGEMFDSTIGARSVLMPFGGKYQLTPASVMAAKPPVKGETDTVTVSAFGCSPQLLEDSPFVGAIHSILTAASKLVASGVSVDTVRLSLQEFFMRLNKEPERWGQPLSALLGALYAQIGLGLGAIGGKDSMSGTFEHIDVPPTLICFGMGIYRASKLISNTFDGEGKVFALAMPRDGYGVPDFKKVLAIYSALHDAIDGGKVRSAGVVEEGGLVAGVVKSCLGNRVGVTFDKVSADMFAPRFGDIFFVADDTCGLDKLGAKQVAVLGGRDIVLGGKRVTFDDAAAAFEGTLEKVYPTTAPAVGDAENFSARAGYCLRTAPAVAVPRVLIPAFPGTNCEDDTARAFERAGAKAKVFVIKNRSAADIQESVDALVKELDKSQILAFPGGFSGGDEPDGSGKFIATTFRNPAIAEAVMRLLYKRDGLALGICNGFQALIKLGLVPYGDIREQLADAPTLTFNNISRHVSTMVDIRVATDKSPWLSSVNVGDVFKVPVSHGEGRFVSGDAELDKLIAAGQVATQYVDLDGNATMVSPFNPNGSMCAIEGIISPDGRVLGKMGHAERLDENLYRNVEGNYDMQLFKSGVKYFL